MQSKLESAIEAFLNVGTGMLVSWVLTLYVLPAYGLAVTGVQAFEITVIYTVVSVVRSYCWRRFFNKRASRRLSVIPNRRPISEART